MAKKTTKKRTSRKAPAKKAAATTTENGRIPLKAVCAELGMDATPAVRARLRRVWRDDADKRIGNPDHVLRKRWDLTPAQARRVKEILSASA